MIAIEFEGRLGNQMFQYAFAATTAKRLGTFILIANDSLLSKYFKIRIGIELCRVIVKIPYLRTLYRRKLVALKTQKFIDGTDCAIKSEKTTSQIQDNAYYKGYFQSVSYFDEKIAKELFVLKRKYREQFDDRFGVAFAANKTIVAHVRRGDYLTHGLSIGSKNADVSLPKAYYDACFRQIDGLDNYQIYFIGDDMMFAKEVGEKYKNAKYVHESEIVDFQLLMNADICVISNSTFAWWGAYLNRKENKQVYAPKYFLGFHEKKEYPNGIYIKTGNKEIEW